MVEEVCWNCREAENIQEDNQCMCVSMWLHSYQGIKRKVSEPLDAEDVMRICGNLKEKESINTLFLSFLLRFESIYIR